MEWDDYITADYDRSEGRIKVEHHGGGSRDVSGFDNAWDVFNDYRDHPDYKGVRLIIGIVHSDDPFRIVV